MSDWNTPLTFTAVTAGSTVQLTKTGDFSIDVIQYRTSTEDAWSTYTMADVITLSTVGDYVQFQNTGNTLSQAVQRFVQFVMTGSIAASGNIQALLNYREDVPGQSFLRLFQDCTALVQAPELPSTNIIGQYCYYQMFRGCTSLTETPELPATELKVHCYREMFYGCTSLVIAHDLPATTLATSCYQDMFNGCKALVTAPALPATTLVTDCYRTLFYNCNSIRSIRVGFKQWGDPSINATANWVYGLPLGGVFFKPLSLSEKYGRSEIPDGWGVVNTDEIECSPGLPTLMDPLGVTVGAPLTLTAVEAGSTVVISVVQGYPAVSEIRYRRGASGAWLRYTIDDVITLSNVGDCVQFCNNATTLNFLSNNCRFYLTGGIEASGALESMVNWSSSLGVYSFTGLFYGNTALLSVPEFTASTLNTRCYSQCFTGCSNITGAVILPATTPANNCYQELVAEAAITSAHIKLQSLATYCLFRTFRRCRSLSKIEVDFSSWGEDLTHPTQGWVDSVASSGTFIKPSALPEEYGINRIPEGWTVINKD